MCRQAAHMLHFPGHRLKHEPPVQSQSGRSMTPSGRSAVYAAERQGRSPSSPYRAGFRMPRARSGWSNFRYQQQQYNTHGVATVSVHLGTRDSSSKGLI